MGSAHVRRLDLSSAIIAVSWCLLVIATGKIIVNYEDTRILSFPYSGEWLSTIHVFPVLQAIQTIPIRLALRGGAGDQEMGGTEPQTPAQIKAKKLIDEAWEAHSGGDSHEAERLFKAALREVRRPNALLLLAPSDVRAPELYPDLVDIFAAVRLLSVSLWNSWAVACVPGSGIYGGHDQVGDDLRV
eukprot:2309896-Rhodomonas_salina.1